MSPSPWAWQVIETFDPNIAGPQYQPKANYVWQDVVAVRVKIHQRFADVSGTFVLHCHILAHEDRGMMQLVQIVDPKTLMLHHH